MPIVNQDVRDGDPVEEAGGIFAGIVIFTFSDGREVQKRVVAKSLQEWSNKIIDLPDIVEAEVARADAESDLSDDEEIAAKGEATREQRALAYLRKAYSLDDPYKAFLLFDRFNEFRVQRGWSLDQVESQLAGVGLGAEEWAAMRAAYTYLAGGGRPAVMLATQTINENWASR